MTNSNYKDLLKIFVAFHKPFFYVKNEIFEPVQVGSNIHKIDLGFISDNTGDNISNKNKNYAELTLLYWVWKNCKLPDYVGFCHYRRYFSFLNNYDKNSIHISNFKYEYNVDKYKVWDINNIINAVKDNDLILPKPVKYEKYTMEKQFVVSHGESNFELMIETAKEFYPQWTELIEEARNLQIVYFFNIFIAKKEIFYDYMDFLFKICFSLEDKINLSRLPDNQRKIFGFLGERIFNIYLHILKSTKTIKIKELPLVFIDDSIESMDVLHKENKTKKVPTELEHNYFLAKKELNNYFLKTIEYKKRIKELLKCNSSIKKDLENTIIYILSFYKSIAIFGLGKSGKMTYEFIKEYFPEKIKYFIDDNIKGKYEGIPIVTTDEFLEKYQDKVDLVVFGKYQHLNPKLLPNLKSKYLKMENII